MKARAACGLAPLRSIPSAGLPSALLSGLHLRPVHIEVRPVGRCYLARGLKGLAPVAVTRTGRLLGKIEEEKAFSALPPRCSVSDWSCGLGSQRFGDTAPWVVVLAVFPDGEHVDGELASNSHDRSLLGIGPTSLAELEPPPSQPAVLAKGAQEVMGTEDEQAP